MASAAAVGADASKSPLPDHEVDETLNTVGTITSADHFRSPDSASEEEQDEDVVRRDRRALQKAEPVTDDDQQDQGSADEELDEDLFGDDDAEPEPPSKRRHVDGEDLDSGDDDGRDDRRVGDIDEDGDAVQGGTADERAVTVEEVEIGRHPIPAPSDGEMYLMKIPKFFSIEPHQFAPQSFQPPVTDHHSNKEPSTTFSAYKTAMTTIRWRQSPSNPSELQSNARVVRWSNGELTLQFAADPKTHYPITGNSLAPPQRNPSKPTPTSKKGPKRAYDAAEDNFTYLAAPEESSSILRVTNKLTTGLKVQSATDASNEALERLQASLASATRLGNHVNRGGISMVRITEDPELAKKKAELAEKEKMKAQKRREAAELRNKERQGRVLGGRGMGAGLTIGGLEDDDELGKGITRLPPVGRKKQKGNRRGEIYSEDEDEFTNRGRTREDEYDEEDDFVARSDEEEEVVDDDDEDDGITEEPRDRRDQAASPKRSGPSNDDAEGDVDDEPASQGRAGPSSPQSRNKRRRVIEEDEDE